MAGYVQDFSRALNNTDLTKLNDVDHLEQAGFYIPKDMDILDVFNNPNNLKF